MDLVVLYGGVTGNSEAIAHLIGAQAEDKPHLFSRVRLQCMRDVASLDELNDTSGLAVIVSSTTGDGDQPQDAQPFLQRVLGRAKLLSSFRFALLGLGDSNYSAFCQGPKVIYQALVDRGAKAFLPPGWADDGIGLEVVVEPWIDRLWEAVSNLPINTTSFITSKENREQPAPLKEEPSSAKRRMAEGIRGQMEEDLRHLKIEKWRQRLGGSRHQADNGLLAAPTLAEDAVLTVPSAPAPFLKLDLTAAVKADGDAATKKEDNSYLSPHQLKGREGLYMAEISGGKKLTSAGAVKDTYMVKLGLETSAASTLALEPGDALDVVCGNPDSEVKALLDCLGVDRDFWSAPCMRASLMADCKKTAKVPEFLATEGEVGLSLLDVFTHGVEIRSVPKKPMIRMLVDHTRDKAERRRLEELCSRQGGNNYLSSIRAANICLLDILLAFPSCLPPLERVLEHLPPLQARPYSIASWQDVEGGAGPFSYDVAFTLVDIDQAKGRQYPRQGVSSSFLSSFCNNEIVSGSAYVAKRKKKSFRPPRDRSHIMIGAGAGVAPFRSFLMERQWINARSKEDNSVTAWLVFGCRSVDKDYLFEDEWATFLSNDTLNEMDVCFSREGGNENVKYVQHILRENGKRVAGKILTEDAMVFVCGSNAMAKDVSDTLVQVLHRHGGLTEGQAREKVADMRVKDVYLQEIWS